MRFEDCPQLVILPLGERVVFVVVAFGTIQRHAEERLRGVLDRVVEPHVAIEFVPTASEIACRPQRLRIGRSDFIAGEHLADHLVVGLIGVERFDDPISPAPDVPLAVANFVAKARPIAVSPDVHPVPAPTFAVVGAGEQVVDNIVQ